MRRYPLALAAWLALASVCASAQQATRAYRPSFPYPMVQARIVPGSGWTTFDTGLDTKKTPFSREFATSGQVVAIPVQEAGQGGTDLDGDGSADDLVLHVCDARRSRVTNLALQAQAVAVQRDLVAVVAAPSGRVFRHDVARAETVSTSLFLVGASGIVLQDGFLAGTAHETPGFDRNADGDTLDSVLDSFPFATPPPRQPLPRPVGLAWDFPLAVPQRTMLGLFVSVSEATQGGIDRNGDGDALDRQVAALVEPLGSAPRNLGLAIARAVVSTDRLLAFEVVEPDQGGLDLNGDGDGLDNVLHVLDRTTSSVTNLRLRPGIVYAHGEWLSFLVAESSQSMDLNGDGDALDRVVHVHRAGDPAPRNLGLSAISVVAAGQRLFCVVEETSQANTDLNGDGDTVDLILFTSDLETGITSNLVVALLLPLQGNATLVSLPVSEVASHLDLDGNGIVSGTIQYLYDAQLDAIVATGLLAAGVRLAGERLAVRSFEGYLGADWNGDTDINDHVVLVYEAGSGVLVNTGLAGEPLLGERLLAVAVEEASQGLRDRNGDGDLLDEVVSVVRFP